MEITPWNRNPNGSPITERDIEVAILDGVEMTLDEIRTHSDRAVKRGDIEDTEQARLEYAWNVIIRKETER